MPDTPFSRRCSRVLALLLLALGGCASLPPPQQQSASSAIAAATSTELGARALHAVAQAGAPSGQSGFLPMPQASVALDARLTLIHQAQSSLDLQYYLLGN